MYKLTYFRFADDYLFLRKDKKKINKLFCILNKIHSSIRFTSEKKDNDFAFLDVLVLRHENKFFTNV